MLSPVYDERFLQRGFNKDVHIAELHARGYGLFIFTVPLFSCFFFLKFLIMENELSQPQYTVIFINKTLYNISINSLTSYLFLYILSINVFYLHYLVKNIYFRLNTHVCSYMAFDKFSNQFSNLYVPVKSKLVRGLT